MPERLRMTLEQELEAGLAQLGLELSAEQIDRLNQYLALLNKWNKTYNLTAVRETERMVAYHVLDIMQAVEESSVEGRHVLLESTVERPAPLPLGLLRGELDT